MKRLLSVLGVVLAGLVVLVVGFGAWLVTSAAKPGRPVGVQTAVVRDADRQPLAVTVFYPTTARPGLTWVGAGFAEVAVDGPVAPGRHPVVVTSHGTSGSPTSHLDTVLALVDAGYVVAAPMHNGDNFRDDSLVGRPDWIGSRAGELQRVGAFMTTKWKHRGHVDGSRIGLFGFSAGGTSALVALGGRLDMDRVAPHCRTAPELVCRLVKPASRAAARNAAAAAPASPFRAAVIAAPGFGFAFEPADLAEVRAPVQLWAGDADDNAPAASNAALVRRTLPAPPEYHLVKGAGHAAFLTPCGPMAILLPPMLCRDAAGFDRAKFHKRFNTEVVRFLDRELGRTT